MYVFPCTLYVACNTYMLGAKYGFAQSTDSAAQTMDPNCAQSMDRAYLRVQSTNSWTIHGLRCVNNCSPGSLADPVQG